MQALRLAQAAGDRAYGSYVLVTMSRQAVYLGHGREAVQLARVAQQGVGSAAPPLVQALLHAAEARGHGVLGEVRACTVFPGPRGTGPGGGQVGRGRAARGRASSTRRSWRTRRATATGTSSSTGRPRCTPSVRCSCAARASHAAASSAGSSLATARLGLGEVEQACALAAEAAQQAAEMRSVRAHEYVRDFERRLEPYRDAAPVRGYREKVAALG